MSSKCSFLSTVPYRIFDKWYVEFYLNQIEYTSNYDMIRLKELITPVKRVIKKDSYDGKLPVVSKIVFKTGEIVFRKENKTGMDLLDVRKGDLLISSINFHQGAVAFNDIGNFVCSTHYQTFEINVAKIIPEYLVLVLRTQKFIDMVAGIKANGIKNESGYDFISSFQIPVPSIPEQGKVLDKYHKTLNQAQELNVQAEGELKKQLINIQKNVSSYAPNTSVERQRESLLNVTRFTSTDRWEIGYIYKEGVIDSVVDSFKYPSMPIGKMQTGSLFGLSVKASLEKKAGMIPVLRMSNVQEGEVHYDGLKYLPLECAVSDKEPDKWLLRKGDFLITRTNGSKDLVGKAAVFDSDDIYTVADGLFCREIDGLFCRSSPDIIVRRRCVLSHKRRGWLQPSPSFRYSRNLALQDELYHPVINNGPAVLVCVDKRLGTGPVNQSRDAG